MDCKTCIGCGENKPLGDFYSSLRDRGGQGLKICYASRCKLCHKWQSRSYTEQDPFNPQTNPDTRFWSKVDKSDAAGCWLWTGRLNKDERPVFTGFGNRPWMAWRYAWESLNGPLPDRTPIRPNCGHGLCVRPEHMIAARFPSYDPHMTKKRCSVCGEHKPISCYGGAGSGKAGKRLSGRCKTCNADYLKTRRFGISVDNLRIMNEQQGGRCAICRRTAEEAGKRSLAIDHCHATRQIRGLLCGACNAALGLLGEDLGRVRAMADYIARPLDSSFTIPNELPLRHRTQ